MNPIRISFKTLLIALFLCTSILAKNSFFLEAEKLFKEKNQSRKECILLPFKAVKKIVSV